MGQRELGDAPRSPQDTGTSALRWAITAMHDTTRRLGRVRASDRAQAFAVIGEAVWWVTIVDATLVRHYPDDYDAALDGLADAERAGDGDHVRRPAVRAEPDGLSRRSRRLHPTRVDDAAGGDAPITEWTWRSLPEPAVATLPPRGQEWELSRYQAYQDVLAGQQRRRDLRPDLRLPRPRGPHRAGRGDAAEADARAAEADGERRAPTSSHISNAEFLSAR